MTFFEIFEFHFKVDGEFAEGFDQIVGDLRSPPLRIAFRRLDDDDVFQEVCSTPAYGKSCDSGA
jgi:hypothetical protein